MRPLAILAVVPFLSLVSSPALSESMSVVKGQIVQAEAWPEYDLVVEISPAVRRERAVIIRDTAASAGMTNGVLLAGIGEVETNFSHCWSEATWACQGPNSSSCNNGPVIAGSADGPCGNEQGGLGLFQFDSGTYSQTIATYGPDIVTMEGNVNAVVPFLVTRAIQSVEGVNSEQDALDWMNSIPIVDGDPKFEEWLYFVAWRYNGCQGCTNQQNKYRAGTHTLLAEMGADFWMSTATEPSAPEGCLPVSSVGSEFEESDPCFVEFGPSQFWRHESDGHGGNVAWTLTTDNSNASNYGVWYLAFSGSGRYQVEVYSDGAFAKSTQAAYEIGYAGGNARVLVDQSRAGGWSSLGSFEFSEDALYTIRLADNTGEANPGVELGFDTLRVTPVGGVSGSDAGTGGGGDGGGGGGGGGAEPDDDDGGLIAGCGCSSSQGSGYPDLGWLLLAAITALYWRRQRVV
ncbi:MAG: hypothetical protein JKY56_05985 [Kofleriaceae bacterium]|nr:hypothetical protein [Kofleriaceae bacterium]